MSHDTEDLDSSVFAGHHSLGPKATQAAAGNHKHKDITDRLTSDEARLTALELKPFAVFQRAANQSITNNANNDIIWTLEVADSDNIGDLTVNNTTFTIKTAGFYLVTMKGAFASNITGVRQVFFFVNGAAVTTWQLNSNVTGTFFFLLSDIVQLAVNDAVKMVVLQNSGAALNVNSLQIGLSKLHD